MGIVCTTEQNSDLSVRVLGARRIVLAFDPQADDPELLRTVVILLRTVALTATARTGTTEIATAQEKITEALSQITKIDGECAALGTGIRRLMEQALAALAGAATRTAGQDSTATSSRPGAA